MDAIPCSPFVPKANPKAAANPDPWNRHLRRPPPSKPIPFPPIPLYGLPSCPTRTGSIFDQSLSHHPRRARTCRPDFSTPPTHAPTSGPPNKQPSPADTPAPSQPWDVLEEFTRRPFQISNVPGLVPRTSTIRIPTDLLTIPTGSTPEQHFSPFLSLIGSSHSMQRHSRLSYALADLVATDYNLGYSFGIK